MGLSKLHKHRPPHSKKEKTIKRTECQTDNLRPSEGKRKTPVTGEW